MFVENCLILAFGILSTATAQDHKLVLEENFDSLDLTLWQHQITLAGGGFQWYSNNRTNSYVEDGKLIIAPTLTSDEIGLEGLQSGKLDIWGSTPADQCTGNLFDGCLRVGGLDTGNNILNPIKSASIRTVESFFFRYGRVEVRAKLPKGDWLWPAIWMLPRYNNYGGWPASGEIDIMEARGNAPGYRGGGSNQYRSTLHWGPDYSANGYPNTHQTHNADSDLSDDYHVYGFIWNETYIGTYLDTEDQVVLSVPINNQSFWERGGWGDTRYNPWQRSGKNAPFDIEYYLIINLAVGGTSGFFPDGHGKPWSNANPHAVNDFWNDRDNWLPTWTQPMEVDYVKVWTDPNQPSLAGFNRATTNDSSSSATTDNNDRATTESYSNPDNNTTTDDSANSATTNSNDRATTESYNSPDTDTTTEEANRVTTDSDATTDEEANRVTTDGDAITTDEEANRVTTDGDATSDEKTNRVTTDGDATSDEETADGSINHASIAANRATAVSLSHFMVLCALPFITFCF